LEGSFHGGVTLFAFVDGAALVVGSDEGGNHFVVADFNAADFLDEAVNVGVLGFRCFGLWH
jgi:hypothetical protein